MSLSLGSFLHLCCLSWWALRSFLRLTVVFSAAGFGGQGHKAGTHFKCSTHFTVRLQVSQIALATVSWIAASTAKSDACWYFDNTDQMTECRLSAAFCRFRHRASNCGSESRWYTGSSLSATWLASLYLLGGCGIPSVPRRLTKQLEKKWKTVQWAMERKM